MPKLDKSAYREGMTLHGDDYWSEMTSSPPVTYGQTLKRPVLTSNLAEIKARLDAAKRKLDEIAAFKKRARR